MTFIFSTVPSERLNNILKKSFFQAFPGVCLIGIPSKILPPSLCFLLGILIIITSFKPYRTIRHLEVCPHILSLEEDYWGFYYHETPLFKIKFSNIKSMTYQERRDCSGISLKMTAIKDLTLLKKNKSTRSLLKKLITINEKEIIVFLPYFSRSALFRLQEYLGSNDPTTDEIMHSQ